MSPGLVHLHAAEHLPDNHFDVFIIDIHTGIAVHALYLFHQVDLHRLAALDAQDILWIALAGA